MGEQSDPAWEFLVLETLLYKGIILSPVTVILAVAGEGRGRGLLAIAAYVAKSRMLKHATVSRTFDGILALLFLIAVYGAFVDWRYVRGMAWNRLRVN